MTDPISFTSTSPRFGLPLLFAGQAQKEFFVNEAFALIDGLLHPAVEGTLNQPPFNSSDGENWLIGELPTGEWTSHAGELAIRQSENWLFVPPRDGMSIFDRAAEQTLYFNNGWKTAAGIAEPAGGSVIDIEARSAILGLIAALTNAGIIAPN